jgi:carbon storage regulator
MLVLSRRSRQSVFIGGQVKVTVLTISPKQVQLGIEAPPQVSVDREEIHLRKQAQLTEQATDTARP